jgi:hypothetical protein
MIDQFAKQGVVVNGPPFRGALTAPPPVRKSSHLHLQRKSIAARAQHCSGRCSRKNQDVHGMVQQAPIGSTIHSER